MLDVELTVLVLHFEWSDTVEEVVETVENVAEIVEDVAEAVEHISSDVADSLPENGALKNAALWVENASKEVAEDVKQALDLIHKVLTLFYLYCFGLITLENMVNKSWFKNAVTHESCLAETKPIQNGQILLYSTASVSDLFFSYRKKNYFIKIL